LACTSLVPDAFPSAAADNARLRGLPKLKVAATWVPWTSALLAAGPATEPASTRPAGTGTWPPLRMLPPPGFLVKAARLLRERGQDASPAGTVEAVRLAEGLAALRGRPGPGLGEVLDAAEASLAGGSPVPLRLIASELLVGHDLGSVPATPRWCRWPATWRGPAPPPLSPEPPPGSIELDLRNDTHRERSQLLHRLAILGIDWGQPADIGRTGGTFKEAWVLQWHPAFEVALVEASAAGTTIETAAVATLTGAAARASDPGDVAALVEEALLAELPAALTALTAMLAERAAQQRDTVRSWRRWNRWPAPGATTAMSAGSTPRPSPRPGRAAHPGSRGPAGGGGGRRRRRRGRPPELVESVDRAVGLLDSGDSPSLPLRPRPRLRRPWLAALRAVADQRGVHGLLAGGR